MVFNGFNIKIIREHLLDKDFKIMHIKYMFKEPSLKQQLVLQTVMF